MRNLYRHRLPISGEAQIRLCRFIVALTAICTLGQPCAAEPTAACAKGPVSDIPESIRQFVDEPDGVTRYIDKSTSDRVNEDAFYLYVIRKGCDVWLRVWAQYLSEKPLNVVRYGFGLQAVELLKEWGATVHWEAGGDFCMGWV